LSLGFDEPATEAAGPRFAIGRARRAVTERDRPPALDAVHHPLQFGRALRAGGIWAMRLVRWLAWSVGFLFLVGTVLQLVDFLNLYTTPPDIPESLNMVDFRLAIQGYRIAIWPIFLLSNLATGVGFMAVTALGLALAGQVASDNSHRVGIAAGLGMAGIFGAVAQLLVIGVTQPTVEGYCDCGFKETEIVSQIWGQQLAESASRWLTNAAGVLAAIGVVAAGTAIRDRMPVSWNIFSWLTAIGLVAAVAIPSLHINPDLDFWVLVAVAGVMVPIWAISLGASLRAGDELVTAET
jgi:hypothetical protein